MENELQLITKVQVQANNVDDADLLVEALQNLKERTDIETIYTDGGYGSPEADETLQYNHVEQIQSAIRGRAPSAEKLNLADFEIKQTAPTQVTCPHQQTVVVHPSSQQKSYVAHFDTEVCRTCPFNQNGACHIQSGKRDTRFHLHGGGVLYTRKKDVTCAPRLKPQYEKSNTPFQPVSYRCEGCSG